MDIHWRQVETFMQVARHSSFARAAEEMCVSAPALIQQTNALERALGVTLFTRGHGGIRLTDAGARFLSGIAQIDGDIARLVEECRDMQANPSVLRVGVCSVWERDFLYRGYLALFERTHPGVRLEVEFTNRDSVVEDCAGDAIDVAMCYEPRRAAEAGLTYVEGHVGNVSAIVTRGDPIAAQPSVRPQDLAGRVALVDADHVSDSIASWLEDAGAVVEAVRYEADTIVRRCSEGCVATFPSRYADMLVPLVNRPFNPPVNYSGGFIYRPAAGNLAREYIALMGDED